MFSKPPLLRTLLALLFLLGNSSAEAADREYTIKGGFLYNFGLYVTWPDKPDPFHIGVLGKDPFGEVLDTIAKHRKLGGAPIKIHRFNSPADYKPVHLLFVSETQLLEEVVRVIGTSPVLIVTDAEGSAQRGAIINFFIENSRVRFEINRRAADQAGLKISSKLLGLARIVDEEGMANQ